MAYVIAKGPQVKQQKSYAARISFRTPSPAIVSGESSGPPPASNQGESRVESNVVLRVSDLPTLQAEPSPVSASPLCQAHGNPRTPPVAQTPDDGLLAGPAMGDQWFDLDETIDMESFQGFIELGDGDVDMDIEFTSGDGTSMYEPKGCNNNSANHREIVATPGMHMGNSPPFQTVVVPGFGRRASSNLHPRSPSAGAVLFPSGELVNFNVFGTNLPFFQLLSAIEQPGTVLKYSYPP
jgi:hypothetical protein